MGGTQTHPPSRERRFQGSAYCGVPVWGRGAGSGQPPGRVMSLRSGPPGQVIWSPQCPHHQPSCGCPLPSDLKTLSPRRAHLGPTTRPCSPSWWRDTSWRRFWVSPEGAGVQREMRKAGWTPVTPISPLPGAESEPPRLPREGHCRWNVPLPNHRAGRRLPGPVPVSAGLTGH